MSDRTSPIRNDILVSGRRGDGMYYVKFMDIEGEGILGEFQEFRSQALTLFPTGEDLFSYLDIWYEKPSRWFRDNFINAFMAALDTVSHKIYGKSFCDWHTQQDVDKLAIQVLLWAAFVAKKYGTKEEPEIYSEVVDG